MADDAVLVWSNALGTGAPFHLSTEVLVEAMTAATGLAWNATESEAYWGSWAVLRRGQNPPNASIMAAL